MSSELYRGMVTSRDWVAVGGIIGLLVAVVGGYYFVVHAAQKSEIDTLTAQNQQAVKDLAEAEVKKKNIDALREEMAKTQQLVSDFETRLPSTREIATLVTQFEAMANEVGLRVNVTPLPIESDQRKQTIPYRIKAYGTFHQVASFLNRLERFERYLKVSDLDLKEEKQGESEAEFKLSTYLFLQPEQTQGKAEDAKPGGAS